MTNHSHSKRLPNWLMLLIFITLMTILWVCGDLFVFILGAIILGLVFANNYDKAHADEH
jgi:hypothetical protein